MSSALSSVSRALFSVAVGICLFACASGSRRFPLKETVWKDEGDFREFSPMPEEYEPATFWEVFDHTLLRPFPRIFAFEVSHKSVNVNAWDEVPDSSWFENRLRRKTPTPAEAARGPCTQALDPAGPFEVIGGKPDGLNPGFLIQTKTGSKFFFKFDGGDQPERATAADVIGSKLYYFVGYNGPCNQMVYFDRKAITLSPKAKIKKPDGTKVPMTLADVNKAFEVVKPNAAGKIRGFASELLPGKPLGPWTHQDTRDDDPNDVIDHEERREVRGSGVMASWTNHFDARDQNTFTSWIDDNNDGKGYVRHFMLDFGDCFGSIWEFDEMSRRHGQTNYLKPGHVLADFVTLGAIWRPWDKAQFGPAGPTGGYYNAENYTPDEWHNGYPLPAFTKMREDDAAWMARKIAYLSDAHLNAIIDEAKLENKILDREMRKAIIGRRDKVLARWLGRLSPLTEPQWDTGTKGRLCVKDLAVHAKVVKAADRSYVAAARVDGTNQDAKLTVTPGNDGETVCVTLPSTKATKAAPAYVTADITAKNKNGTETMPLRVHLYGFGGPDYQIAGLERPDSP